MERKYEILNNDLNSMLGIETRRKQGWDAEWEAEHQEVVKEAEIISSRPQERIDAKRLMEKTVRYAGADNYYIDLFINGSDDQQLSEIRNIEYTAAYTLLEDAICVAGSNLIEKKDYVGWCNVLYALRYVPLQKSFCYELKTHEDYVGVLGTIDTGHLVYPQTFMRTLLGHWFEWLWKVGGQIWSYEDPRRNFENNRIAQRLKEEAKAIREEWENGVADMINEMLALFSKYIRTDTMLQWATKLPLFSTDRDNEYSRAHDGYLKLIWGNLEGMGALKQDVGADANLNLLLLMAEECVRSGDAAKGKIIDGQIRVRLLKENFTGMHVLTKVDVERQKILSGLLTLICPNIQDTRNYMAEVATQYHGWNMDYQLSYEEARRESYLFCCVLRRFEIPKGCEEEIYEKWKEYIALYIQAYRRCDNEYISRDDMMFPFIVAIRIAQEHLSEACQLYLLGVLIEHVLSIVSLLSVFSSCTLHIAGENVERLYCRVEKEWPSARMLMELRGQTALRDRIDILVGELEKAVKGVK